MIKDLRQNVIDLFRPWGADAPDKQHFQLGLSALGGVMVGLAVWVSLQSPAAIEQAYGKPPSINVKVQSASVASEVGADFGRKETETHAAPATAETPKTPAPVIAANPFKVNAVSVTPADLSKPGIAFVVVDFGLSAEATKNTLEQLPPKSSVVVPAGLQATQAINDARAKNMEVWIGLALEPLDYPTNDAGPLSLFQDADQAINRARLDTSLATTQSAAGIAMVTPSPLYKSGPDMDMITSTIFEKGFGLLTRPVPEATSAAKEKKAPLATPDIWLDDEGSTPAEQLKIAEGIAQKQGYVIVLLHPYTDSLKAVSNWVTQAKEFSAIPVSAIAARAQP